MDSNLFLGVDPGANGAWALITAEAKIHSAGLWREFRPDYIRLYTEDIRLACIEKCGARPRAQRGSIASASIVRCTGIWEGFLMALDIPSIEVLPTTWQKSVVVHLPSKLSKKQDETPKELAKRTNENRKAIKEAVVKHVTSRFPDSTNFIYLKKHWDIADAICMAEHARRSWYPDFTKAVTTEKNIHDALHEAGTDN